MARTTITRARQEELMVDAIVRYILVKEALNGNMEPELDVDEISDICLIVTEMILDKNFNVELFKKRVRKEICK